MMNNETTKKRLQKEAYVKLDSPDSGFYTSFKDMGEDFFKVHTTDIMKFRFWTKLFESYSDMGIKLKANSEFAFVKKATPIELIVGSYQDYNLDSSDDSELLCVRILDFFQGIHVDEFENILLYQDAKPYEIIIYNAVKTAVIAYKLALKDSSFSKKDYFLTLDIHEYQFVISPVGDLICIDPINITFYKELA